MCIQPRELDEDFSILIESQEQRNFWQSWIISLLIFPNVDASQTFKWFDVWIFSFSIHTFQYREIWWRDHFFFVVLTTATFLSCRSIQMLYMNIHFKAINWLINNTIVLLVLLYRHFYCSNASHTQIRIRIINTSKMNLNEKKND